MPIYAALGVAEVWFYQNDRVSIRHLSGDKYKEASASLALSFLSDEIVTDFLNKGLEMSSTRWFREVREWINKNG